jgi:hypothetical protein
MNLARFLFVSTIISQITGCGSAPLHDSPAPSGNTIEIPPPTGAQVIHVGTSNIDVRIGDGDFQASHAQMMDWVATGAKAVTNFYGKFPVKWVLIQISAEGDGDEIHGTEYEGHLIRMRLGPNVSEDQLADDWTMTHEMLHLAFPNMGQKHLWMNEGLSVYLEPVARARIGIVSEKRYWRELKEGIENGQPEDGDQGLDVTHTWGRTYWGGTIFWFLADLQIREQTHGRRSVDDAVKTILDADGDGSVQWPMARVLKMGDDATGTHVLSDLYTELALKPTRVDFDPWWQKLGVSFGNHDEVRFDDTAPLAWLRKAITAADRG